jgi:hypothetical protein
MGTDKLTVKQNLIGAPRGCELARAKKKRFTLKFQAFSYVVITSYGRLFPFMSKIDFFFMFCFLIRHTV